MSRLARITQILFGTGGNVGTGGFGAAAGGNTATELATSLSLATLMGTSEYAAGWLSATLGASKFPALEDMNALDYLLSSQIAYILQQGVAEYDAGTTYWQHNIVCKAGTYQLYGSVTDSNVGNALTDTGNWLFLGDLSTLSNPSHFYSGGVTAGSAAAQTLATVTPSGFSLSNDGSTVACTAGFACPAGGVTFAIAGTAAKSAKVLSAGIYIDPPLNQFVLDETIFLTYNVTQGFYVLMDAPALGTVAVTNLDSINFQNTAGNLAFGTAPVLPSATTGTTQTTTDNTTKVATTAFVHTRTTPNDYQASPANPTASGSVAGVMMGLAGAITPATSGNVLIIISGSLVYSTAETATAQIRVGTGSAPANGAALTGTTVGNSNVFNITGGSFAASFPISMNGIASALTLGTPYWIDLSLAASAGTANLTNLSISAVELH